jgi:protein involved in polysaccharide export with SLBB domain
MKKQLILMMCLMIIITPVSILSQDTESVESGVTTDSLDNDALKLQNRDTDNSRTAIEQVYDSLKLEEAEDLDQFGYNLVQPSRTTSSILVDNDYILAPGDELRVYFWGDSVEFGVLEPYYETTVDMEGKIFLGPVGRISAHGLSLGDLEQVITNRVNIRYSNIEVDISPARIRTFSVFISGFVQEPGSVEVNSLWSVADALSLSGGPTTEGTLRNIQVWRGGEQIRIDLYDLFLRGRAVDLMVKEGDIIYVPPVGKTAAAAGLVKRPGIYEMAPGEDVEDLIDYAGGLQITNAALTSRLIRQNGTSVVISQATSDAGELSSTTVRDGDLLLVSPGNAYRSNMVRITGAVLYPGIYDLERSGTLSELIQRSGLRYDADRSFGTIFRESITDEDPGIVFSPGSILDGTQEDIPLRPNDVVQLYTAEPTYHKEPVRLTGMVAEPGVVSYEEGMRLLDVLRSASFTEQLDNLQIRIIRDDEVFRQIYLYDLMIRGRQDLDVMVEPGDMVAVVTNESRENVLGIKVLGQVRDPGSFVFDEQIRLSDAIEMAGGFTAEAYPEALYLIRESVRDEQVKQLQKTIAVTREELDSIEASIALQTNLSADEKSIVNAQIAQQRVLLERAAENRGDSLGRIALTLPSTIESLRGSDDDIVLNEGDYIFVPKRSEFVTVIGDIDSTIALPWRASKRVKDYLFDLGGLRPRDYQITIIKHNGKVVTEDNLFYGWSTIEGQKLDPSDVIIAVKKIKIPSGTKILNVLADVTDVVYKAVYTLDSLNYFN